MDPLQHLLIKQQIHTALLEVFGTRLSRDSDGDWPVQVGSRLVYIKIELAPLPHAFVFARAATNTTPDCLAELHDLNLAAAWAKVARSVTGDVLVFQRVAQQCLSAESLRQAIQGVATCADDCGPMLEAVYGIGTSAAQGDR